MEVGYYTRFLGERLAEECAQAISANAFKALLCDAPVPTPAISHVIRSTGAICGIKRYRVPQSSSVHRNEIVDPLYETLVGFKDIGELINEDKIVIGDEESAGLSIKGHYPEKDGVLACLLAAEAVAARGESLTEQLQE